MERDKWVPTYFINDFGCRGVILATTLAAIGINYDYDKCMYLKVSSKNCYLRAATL